MKTATSYLLPHSFQRIGWALLTACPILFGVLLWVFNGLELIPQRYSQFGTLALYVALALAALFIGLSEEKQEDEFIQTLRLRSLANTAWFCFLLFILSCLTIVTMTTFRLSDRFALWSTHQFITSFVFAFIVYIAIFRFRLYKYRKEAGHEE